MQGQTKALKAGVTGQQPTIGIESRSIESRLRAEALTTGNQVIGFYRSK